MWTYGTACMVCHVFMHACVYEYICMYIYLCVCVPVYIYLISNFFKNLDLFSFNLLQGISVEPMKMWTWGSPRAWNSTKVEIAVTGSTPRPACQEKKSEFSESRHHEKQGQPFCWQAWKSQERERNHTWPLTEGEWGCTLPPVWSKFSGGCSSCIACEKGAWSHWWGNARTENEGNTLKNSYLIGSRSHMRLFFGHGLERGKIHPSNLRSPKKAANSKSEQLPSMVSYHTHTWSEARSQGTVLRANPGGKYRKLVCSSHSTQKETKSHRNLMGWTHVHARNFKTCSSRAFLAACQQVWCPDCKSQLPEFEFVWASGSQIAWVRLAHRSKLKVRILEILSDIFQRWNTISRELSLTWILSLKTAFSLCFKDLLFFKIHWCNNFVFGGMCQEGGMWCWGVYFLKWSIQTATLIV